MKCVINDLTEAYDFEFIDKNNNKVGLLNNGERMYLFSSADKDKKMLCQLLEEIDNNISSVYRMTEEYCYILIDLIDRFEYKGKLSNLCREILKYVIECAPLYKLYGYNVEGNGIERDEDVFMLKTFLYPKIEELGRFNRTINEMFDMVFTLDKFSMYNYDSHINNEDIQGNGDINIAYTTYDYKDVEDVEINVIFNIIDKTVKTIFTIYKDFNDNSYYADFCIYEEKFTTVQEIVRYFRKIDFDVMTSYGCEFEDLVEQQAPNWQLINKTNVLKEK